MTNILFLFFLLISGSSGFRWSQKRAQTDAHFKIPNILDLHSMWTKWLEDNNKKDKKCKTDKDCHFPLYCCHLISSDEHYCCPAWNEPKTVPQYAFN